MDVFGAAEAAIDAPINVAGPPIAGSDVSMSVSGGPKTIIDGSPRRSGALASPTSARSRTKIAIPPHSGCYFRPMLAVKSRAAAFVDHPAWKAALRAPVEAETDEEREAVAEAMRSGALIAGADVTAEIARHRS